MKFFPFLIIIFLYFYITIPFILSKNSSQYPYDLLYMQIISSSISNSYKDSMDVAFVHNLVQNQIEKEKIKNLMRLKIYLNLKEHEININKNYKNADIKFFCTPMNSNELANYSSYCKNLKNIPNFNMFFLKEKNIDLDKFNILEKIMQQEILNEELKEIENYLNPIINDIYCIPFIHIDEEKINFGAKVIDEFVFISFGAVIKTEDSCKVFIFPQNYDNVNEMEII